MPTRPFVVGCEGGGVVEEIQDEVAEATGLRRGDRVVCASRPCNWLPPEGLGPHTRAPLLQLDLSVRQAKSPAVPRFLEPGRWTHGCRRRAALRREIRRIS